MENIEIKNYYNQLAKAYDDHRFNNSYGQYIDQQERHFLDRFTQKTDLNKSLDLGCGTGRLLDYANNGVDFSFEMLSVAQAKYPEKNLQEGQLSAIPFADRSLELIYCFHVLMHQDHKTTVAFFQEAHRVLQPNGRLIVDFPSAKRRKTVKHQQPNWHAANQLSLDDIKKLTQDQWKIVHTEGLMFLPVHRIPKSIRPYCLKVDTQLCRSFLKELASYYVVVLEKQE